MKDIDPVHILVAIGVIVLFIFVVNRCNSHRRSSGSSLSASSNKSTSESFSNTAYFDILEQLYLERDCMEPVDEPFDCSWAALNRCFHYCSAHPWRCKADTCENIAKAVTSCNERCQYLPRDSRKECVQECRYSMFD
jgi:hypothetical protein